MVINREYSTHHIGDLYFLMWRSCLLIVFLRLKSWYELHIGVVCVKNKEFDSNFIKNHLIQCFSLTFSRC